IREEARSLVAQLDFPEEQSRALLASLDRILADTKFRDEMQQHAVSGVAVYAGGSGGLFVSGGGAPGRASSAGGRRAVPFKASAVSVGAIGGGQATWGVGLILGLAHEAWFPGEYDGTTTGATAVQTSVGWGQLESEWHAHKVQLVSV